jgi:hypothetical protein
MVDGTVRLGGGVDKVRQLAAEGNVNRNDDVVHLLDENNTNRTMLASTSAIDMCRHHCCIGKDGVFGAVVVNESDHDRTVRPWGRWEGGDRVVGRGHNDNNEGEE